MKLILSLLAIIQIVYAAGEEDKKEEGKPSPYCLNCKIEDARDPFLVSHSYCQSRDICVKDEIMYINQFCPSGWVAGW